MNKRDKDILLQLVSNKYTGQRDLGKKCNCSLGAVNASVSRLVSEGYVDSQMIPTDKCRALLQSCAPKRAVLLAAGVGIRNPRSSLPSPKPLQKVCGERIIDRLITQLHSVGVTEIYAVVGYAKEQFEYLIDEYNVKLIVNPEYADKNNLHSLSLAKEHLNNCYVVPCDLHCRQNPFRTNELYSWYAVSDKQSVESSVRINRKQDLAVIPPDKIGNVMIGISYLTGSDSENVASKLKIMDLDKRYKGYFWEETLYDGEKLLLSPRLFKDGEIIEINTFDTLRELNLRSRDTAIFEITRILNTDESQIHDLKVIKRGLNNTTFSFIYNEKSYCIRIPGDLYDKLIVHSKEADVVTALKGCDFANNIIYFDKKTGIMISEYISSVRECDPYNTDDVMRCMKKLKSFHDAHLSVPHTFDLFKAIDFYESRWQSKQSLYNDYSKVKENVFSLKKYIDSIPKDYCLTHIDAVAENFMIPTSDEVDIKIIDWEYAGMQDPHLDIAMFCIMAMYDKEAVDKTIDIYFDGKCPESTRLKIYCYIAVSGLLWSNWCEYEIQNGTEFGEYSLKQYRYAKEYYKLVKERI